MSTKKMMTLPFYLDAAKGHGEDSGPDFEVGDLQAFMRVMWGLMTPNQRLAFAKHSEVHDALEGALVDYEEELKQLV